MAEDSLLWDELQSEHNREQIAHLQQQQRHSRPFKNDNVQHGAIANQLASKLGSAMQQTAQVISAAATLAAEKSKDVFQKDSAQPKPIYGGGGIGGYGAQRDLLGHYRPPSIVSSNSHDEEDDENVLPFASTPSHQTTGGNLMSSVFSSHTTQHDHYHPLQTSNEFISEEPTSPYLYQEEQQSQYYKSSIMPDNSTDNDQSPREDNNDYEVIAQFQRRFRMEGWGAVADLDSFFASVYNYYYHKGLIHIVGKGTIELLSLFFTFALSIFLFAYLDWSSLLQCRDESTCQESFSSYIREKPFEQITLLHFLLGLYSIIVVGYGILSCFRFYASVKDAFYAKAFYEDKLGISARKLEGGAVEWDEIVCKIMELQRSGEYRIAIHGQDDLDALNVAQRILRKENFLVAFVNHHHLLDLRLPMPRPLPGDQGYSKYNHLCTSMEWTLYACLLNHMFNRQHKIRPSFYDANLLKRRFIIAGVAHLIFMPFLLFFMTLHFLLVNMYVWRSSKDYMGSKEWSPMAKWTFREFNELPHVFERRLGPSYTAADDYLKLFTQSPLVSYLGRALLFVSGSLVAVLLSFAAINDAILLNVKISQWNLLWYVGMLGIAFSVGKGMLPDVEIHPPYTYNLHAEMEGALTRVASHTHHFPDFWKKRSWKEETQAAFSAMFQPQSKLFIMEILSTIMAPYVLCVSLPKAAVAICAFVHNAKVEVPGLGDVCGFACFDFNEFQDENWEGRQIDLHHPETSYYDYIIKNERPKTREGKMEKSFFSFKESHPSWVCNPSGQTLVDKIAAHRKIEQARLVRERQLYVEAATRQLLEALEDSKPFPVRKTISVDVGAHTFPLRVQTDMTSSADKSGGRPQNEMQGRDTEAAEPQHDTGNQSRYIGSSFISASESFLLASDFLREADKVFGKDFRTS